MRCCVYKERAILSERIKLAMGGDKSNPNVIEVIDIACDECPVCGYSLPTMPPRGPKYAIYADSLGSVSKASEAERDLQKYCGYSEEYAKMLVSQYSSAKYGCSILLRRGLTDSAARYLAANLRDTFFDLKIVLDEGEAEDELLVKDSAMELPPSVHPEKSGIGFWGVVGAVIVALLILSIF